MMMSQLNTEKTWKLLKIKFQLDGDLPLSKTLNILDMITVAASVFEKNGKYYPKFFLHECSYKL